MSNPEQGSTPEIEKRHSYVFNDAIHLFPEEERAQAEKLAAINDQISLLAHSNFDKYMEVYQLVDEFCQRMIKKYGDGTARRYKLFHMISGSSLFEDDWRFFPLDTPEGEFDIFITETLASMT